MITETIFVMLNPEAAFQNCCIIDEADDDQPLPKTDTIRLPKKYWDDRLDPPTGHSSNFHFVTTPFGSENKS